MYFLDTPIYSVKGIGDKLTKQLQTKGIETVSDLLLFVPLRYEDRSQMVEIFYIPTDELVTFQAEVTSVSNYYKGRRSIQSATVKDRTGRIKLMWFNNKWIVDRLHKGQSYLFSGKKNNRGVVVQPTVEDIKNDTIHTGRLVPIYSSLGTIKQGSFRRILKNVVDHLKIERDSLQDFGVQNLEVSFKQIHFPDEPELVVKARERFALEELLGLMQHSHQIKEQWKKQKTRYRLKISEEIPQTIPFELTRAQSKASQEILADLQSDVPMNRLLVGDVGSGKTVVAGIAAWHTIKNNYSAALIAPTQILAEQHFQTLHILFPDVEIELLTGKKKPKNSNQPSPKTKLYVGTHALINQLPQIKPALVIYDEQHKFGVSQRTPETNQTNRPHTLTMTATPIPRSLMLTIFSHLNISTIDQMPKGRKPIKSWYTPQTKRLDAYNWLFQELQTYPQATAIVVCPFIHQSSVPAFQHVPSAEQTFTQLKQEARSQQKTNSQLHIELLHGQMTQKQKDTITQKLFQNKIDLLVTTPIVEVGLDVPTATYIVIEGAERFGMASLHQMRGRVGRAGQQAYCLLFTSPQDKNQIQSGKTSYRRLHQFCQETNGLELAEQDLKNRGAGDLFGTQQHGFDNLQFAEWTNLQLITKARQIYQQLEQKQTDWKPLTNQKTVRPTAAN